MTLRPSRSRKNCSPLPGPTLSPSGELTLSVPLPAKGLSPNSRAHWRAKASLTKSHRTRAKLEFLAAASKFQLPASFSAYRLTFYHALRRARDDDNAAASCKAYRDGIADALRIDDSTLSHHGTTLLIDSKLPRLEITLIP